MQELLQMQYTPCALRVTPPSFFLWKYLAYQHQAAVTLNCACEFLWFILIYFVNKMFPKAIASLLYALSAYKMFHRDTLVLDSQGKSVLWIMLQWTLEHMCLFECFLSYNNSMFSFFPELVPIVFCTPFYIHTSNMQEFQFLHILAKVCSFFLSFFLVTAILMGVK